MVNHYKLHTKYPVLVSSNQLQLNCSLDWFFAVQSSFFSSYLIRQPVAVVVASQKGKKKKTDLTGL